MVHNVMRCYQFLKLSLEVESGWFRIEAKQPCGEERGYNVYETLMKGQLQFGEVARGYFDENNPITILGITTDSAVD